MSNATPTTSPLGKVVVGVSIGLAAVPIALAILRFGFGWPTFGNDNPNSVYPPEKLEATLRWEKSVLIADVKYSGIPSHGSRWKVASITLDGIAADHPLPQIGHKATAFRSRR